MVIVKEQTDLPSLKPDAILGKHAIIELSGCDRTVIENNDVIQHILRQATEIAEISIISSLDHHFTPHGYTTTLLLEESHLSLHTWPEYCYASVDLYSCNLQTDFEAVKNFLAGQFRARVTDFVILERGFSLLRL